MLREAGEGGREKRYAIHMQNSMGIPASLCVFEGAVY